jgi:hypothetical protein
MDPVVRRPTLAHARAAIAPKKNGRPFRRGDSRNRTPRGPGTEPAELRLSRYCEILSFMMSVAIERKASLSAVPVEGW